MANQFYIDKYKDFDKIIKNYYQLRDASNKLITIDGIVNPLKIDNRQQCAVTDNQGQTPHCAAYSICNIIEAILWKKTGKLVNLNADQVYAKAKMMDGDLEGEGTYLEYAIKAAVQLGGFDVDNLKIGFLYNSGNQETIERLKFLIHKYDFLHIGFSITESWYRARPEFPFVQNTGRVLGGHAVLACGYDKDGVYIQNSWGMNWGAKGFAIVQWKDFLAQFMYACYIEGIYRNI